MLHARLYSETDKYRQAHFQPIKSTSSPSDTSPIPYLDGNPSLDRPLFVQFCANDPAALLEAAQRVAPYCDAVDLNLGCPQGIAKKGHYGAFLQEDQELIYKLINTLHNSLPVPVTAKIRILDTLEATLAYAKNVLAAGASILTVHGRRREQKGHITGLADWSAIKYLRDNLPPETVLFANGNVLQHGDLERCLEATGADGVMSAEGNLSDPAIFAAPPEVGREGREYWRGKDGKGGWRVDAVMRRYLDILHKYALNQEPPSRRPLFMPGDDVSWVAEFDAQNAESDEPAKKKRKKEEKVSRKDYVANPNFSAMQPHMFHLLRHFVSRHTDVRDMLARGRAGDVEAYEKILAMVERKVADGLLAYEESGGKSVEEEEALQRKKLKNGASTENGKPPASEAPNSNESSAETVKLCKRPWWVAQPIVRPLPSEAVAKGSVTLSKKVKQKQEEDGLKSQVGDVVSEEAMAKPAVSQVSKTKDISALEETDKLVAG
jgi:tRNA-dihydrouridine synthase 1